MLLSQTVEELYKAAIDEISEGVCIFFYRTEYPDIKFLSWNRQMFEITGYTIDEVNQANWFSPLSYDLLFTARIREYIKNAVSGKSVINKELLISTKSGQAKTILISIRILQIDKKDVYLTALVKDITQNLVMEDEAGEIDRGLLEILHNSLDLVVKCDLNGRIIYLSPSCKKVMGYDIYPLTSCDIFVFIHPEDINDVRCHFIDMLKDAKDKPDKLGEYRLRHSDGNYMWFEISGKLSYNKNNEVTGYILFARNITKHRAREQEIDEIMYNDKLRTEFFANISHDLRTPLNVILSAMQLLNAKVKGMLSENQFKSTEKYTSIMRQNCFRLLRLVSNLIDVTKIDSGFLELEPCNVDMVSLVRNITMSVKPYTESKGISLNFYTDTECRTLACDPDKVERILLNLISNAVKFTRSEGVIDVILKDAKNFVQLIVKDNGIGIPKEKQKIIFKRFVKAGESAVEENEGSGIGLSLVKALVEMHGGTINLHSEYAKGSEFVIRLPSKRLPYECDNRELGLNNNSRIDRIAVEFSDIYI